MSDEQRVYRLANEHYTWSNGDDMRPDRPDVPNELKPLYLSGDVVGSVDGLHVFSYPGETPSFSEDSDAVEASPEEVTAWRDVYAAVEKAQHRYRVNMEAAFKVYQRNHREALAELAKATEVWLPVEAELKERSTALATTLAAHRDAAERWKAEQEEKEEARLDSIHGPRALVLYEPKELHGGKRRDHIAQVHLATCGRRRSSARHRGDYLRAPEAWAKLTSPDWPPASWNRDRTNLLIKLCSSCKPWTVLAEHAGVTPQMLRRLPLEDWPKGLER